MYYPVRAYYTHQRKGFMYNMLTATLQPILPAAACGSLKRWSPTLCLWGQHHGFPPEAQPACCKFIAGEGSDLSSCRCRWRAVHVSEGPLTQEMKNLILSCRQQQNATKSVCSEHGQIPLWQRRTDAVISKTAIMVEKIQYLHYRKNLDFNLCSFSSMKKNIKVHRSDIEMKHWVNFLLCFNMI